MPLSKDHRKRAYLDRPHKAALCAMGYQGIMTFLQRADTVFYRRYPHKRGQVVRPTPLALGVRRSLASLRGSSHA